MRHLLRRCSPLWGQKGIGLVETLVVVGLLGLIGTAFLTALATSSKATGTLDEHVQAESLVRAQLERIKDAPYDPSEPYYEGYQVTPPANYSISFTVAYPESPYTTIQEITVTVFHNGDAMLQMTDYKVDR